MQRPQAHAPRLRAAGGRITRIETIPLKVPMERAASGSTLKLTHRCTIITRVHTDQGVTGECFNANDDDLQAPVLRMLHDEMVPRLIGLDILAVEEAWSRMRVSAAPFLKDRRIALRAQALIDSAILDAVGKIAGLPLHVLWGEGKIRCPSWRSAATTARRTIWRRLPRRSQR